MSRSTKKPFYTEQQGSSTKPVKRRASRAIRDLKLDDSPVSGNSYKKVFDSWSIRDWNFSAPKDKKAYRK